MPLRCRFYENQYPSENDVVVGIIKTIYAMGSYVCLPEYNGIEGMILHSELSRRRIRSINKLIRVGKSEIVLVIRVDPEKGYIDLSKRRVNAHEVHKCQERFARAKALNQIVKYTAEKLGYTTNEELEDLCRKTIWYFDKKYPECGGSYDIFKRAVQNSSVFDECDIDENTREILLQNIRHRLSPQAVKFRAEFELSCFKYEGIDAIRSALRCGLNFSTEVFPIKINLIAPPLYVLTTQTLEPKDGIDHMKNVLNTIKESIAEQGGLFSIKQEPRIVSEIDEADLRRHMEELEEANKEVSGDDDDEDKKDASSGDEDEDTDEVSSTEEKSG